MSPKDKVADSLPGMNNVPSAYDPKSLKKIILWKLAILIRTIYQFQNLSPHGDVLEGIKPKPKTFIIAVPPRTSPDRSTWTRANATIRIF